MKAERRRRGERKQGGKANLHKEQHLSEKRKKRLKTNHQLTNTERLKQKQLHPCIHPHIPAHLNIIANADCSSYENTASHANCLRCCGMTPDLNYREGSSPRAGPRRHNVPLDAICLICKCDAACGAHVVRKVRRVCKSSISSSAKSVVLMGIV